MNDGRGEVEGSGGGGSVDFRFVKEPHPIPSPIFGRHTTRARAERGIGVGMVNTRSRRAEKILSPTLHRILTAIDADLSNQDHLSSPSPIPLLILLVPRWSMMEVVLGTENSCEA